MHASPERSGALYRLAGKKAEAVKTRRKTLFPVPEMVCMNFDTKLGTHAPMETESLVKWIAQVHDLQKRPKKLFGGHWRRSKSMNQLGVGSG